MTSLHLEHRVNDLESWLETFRSFDDFRTKGGVTAVQVRHGVEDPNYVAVDLEFDSQDQARAFLGQLETRIWPNNPHVKGAPTTCIFETI